MSFPPIRLLALDLDDTLLRSDHLISPRTLDGLRRWRAAGGQVAVATGRPTRSIAEALPSDFHDVPWITYNGAEVILDGKRIYTNLIGAEDTSDVVRLTEAALPDCIVGVEIDDTLFLNRPMQRTSPYQVARLLDVAKRPAAKILAFHTDMTALDGLLERLPVSTRAIVSLKYQLVQILAASADKAEALRFLVQQLGLEMQNVAAFGDDVNDVDMVREAGYGVAVANAVPEVIAVADCVTASNDEDGVALVIERLLPALQRTS